MCILKDHGDLFHRHGRQYTVVVRISNIAMEIGGSKFQLNFVQGVEGRSITANLFAIQMCPNHDCTIKQAHYFIEPVIICMQAAYPIYFPSSGQSSTYTFIHLPIHSFATSFASSTNPNSNSKCTAPLTPLSNALAIHACV